MVLGYLESSPYGALVKNMMQGWLDSEQVENILNNLELTKSPFLIRFFLATKLLYYIFFSYSFYLSFFLI